MLCNFRGGTEKTRVEPSPVCGDRPGAGYYKRNPMLSESRIRNSNTNTLGEEQLI